MQRGALNDFAAVSPAAQETCAMWNPFIEFETAFAPLDFSNRSAARFFASEPRAARPRVWEDDKQLRIEIAVPSLSEEDIDLSVQDGVLSLRVERKTEVPAGYKVDLSERSAFSIAKRFALPDRTDESAITAETKHGLLTITIPKAKEPEPRKISIKAS